MNDLNREDLATYVGDGVADSDPIADVPSEEYKVHDPFPGIE